jgi:hypothetical protein
MPSHDVQLQDGLYFCDPHNFHTCKWMNQGSTNMLWIWFESQSFKKLINVSTPSQFLAACFVTRRVQHHTHPKL